MKVLVTGAAGFIGAAVAERLLEDGHCVAGMDNLNRDHDPWLKVRRLRRAGIPLSLDAVETLFSGVTTLPETREMFPGEWATLPVDGLRFAYYPVALEDRNGLEQLLAEEQPEAVVHLAARTGEYAASHEAGPVFAENGVGTVQLLEAMRRHGVKKLVLGSSAGLYAGQPAPFHEDGVIGRPMTPYHAGKAAAEAAAHAWHHSYGIDVTVCRYFSVYGPYSRPDSAPWRFFEAIRTGEPVPLGGTGWQRRDFSYIDDIVDGTARALRPLGFEVINLGRGGETTSLHELIRLLEEELGLEARTESVPLRFREPEILQADVTKARELLGWEPRISLREGLRKMIEVHGPGGPR